MKTWAFGLISVLTAIGCVRLGVWQLDRLATRRAANTLIEWRLAQPGITVPELATWPTDSLRYRRVTLTGRYDVDRPIVEVFRTRNGIPGVYLVAPLLVAPDTAVLVERGWAAAPDARSIDVSAFALAGPVAVDGYVRRAAPAEPAPPAPTTVSSFPQFVRLANPRALDVPYELLPVVVRRTGGFEAVELALLGPPDLSEGSHLSYAFQWFAFAAIALIGGAIWIFRQRGEEVAIRY